MKTKQSFLDKTHYWEFDFKQQGLDHRNKQLNKINKNEKEKNNIKNNKKKIKNEKKWENKIK